MVSIIFSVLVPGAAYIQKQRPISAVCVPILGLAIIMVFSWTRFIVNPYAFIAMNVMLLSVHLAAIIHASRLSKPSPGWSRRLFAGAIMAFCIGLVGLMVIGHNNKAVIFGFELYHIPSPSMSPTLLPGDIILVDTWHAPAKLELGQIVVFKRRPGGITLVKRVKRLRQRKNDLQMFVLGDNRRRSADSRQFGWITTDHMIGQVTSVLFALREQNYANQKYPVNLTNQTDI